MEGEPLGPDHTFRDVFRLNVGESRLNTLTETVMRKGLWVIGGVFLLGSLGAGRAWALFDKGDYQGLDARAKPWVGRSRD